MSINYDLDGAALHGFQTSANMKLSRGIPSPKYLLCNRLYSHFKHVSLFNKVADDVSVWEWVGGLSDVKLSKFANKFKECDVTELMLMEMDPLLASRNFEIEPEELQAIQRAFALVYDGSLLVLFQD